MIVKEKTTKKTDGLSLLGIYFLTAYYCIPFFMDLLNPWIPALLGLIIIFLDFSNGKIQTKETISFLLCTLVLFIVMKTEKYPLHLKLKHSKKVLI